MAVIQVTVVFWAFKLCGGQLIRPEYGGSTSLRNITSKTHYMV